MGKGGNTALAVLAALALLVLLALLRKIFGKSEFGDSFGREWQGNEGQRNGMQTICRNIPLPTIPLPIGDLTDHWLAKPTNQALNSGMDKEANWPFDQPRNCATFTTRPVMDRSEPIVLVSHDADDHGWQFIGTSGASMADAMLVSLEEVVRVDPTVLEVADLPPGWQALRDTLGGNWTRREHPIPEEEK